MLRAYVARKEFEAKVVLSEYGKAMAGKSQKTGQMMSEAEMALMGIGVKRGDNGVHTG